MRLPAACAAFLVVLAGCVGGGGQPSGPHPADASTPGPGEATSGSATPVEPDGPAPAAPSSPEWTVVSHLAPRGAMDVRFTVAAPTTCRLALLVHHLAVGATGTEPPHTDLWVDGVPWSLPFSTSSFSNWNDRVQAGPADTRDVLNLVLDAYLTAAYGEGATFASGIGLREVEVKEGGRIVLSGRDHLVDAPEAVNLPDVRGSLMASIECGADVTLDVREDAGAVWANAPELGGDVAAQTLVAGTETGTLAFEGLGRSSEVLVGAWGGVQGLLTLEGAIRQEILFDTLPGEEGSVQLHEGGPGAIDVDWQTVRANGSWWIGLSSWQPHQATITAEGNYPFG